MAKKKLTKEVYLKWYEDMLFWRKFEDMAAALYDVWKAGVYERDKAAKLRAIAAGFLSGWRD